jgi:hypothetical protein
LGATENELLDSCKMDAQIFLRMPQLIICSYSTGGKFGPPRLKEDSHEPTGFSHRGVVFVKYLTVFEDKIHIFFELLAYFIPRNKTVSVSIAEFFRL